MARQLGQKVGSHLALFCIHRMNWSHAMTLSHNVSTNGPGIIIITGKTDTTYGPWQLTCHSSEMV